MDVLHDDGGEDGMVEEASRIEVPTRVGPIPVRVTGEGPAVLAVHCFLLDGRLWDGVVEHLSPAAVRVVVPDLPLGAHRTAVPDRSRLTPPEIAGALVDVLDGVGVERAVLAGNDTGGALSQMVAAAHPERVAGLVLAGCDAFEHFPPPLAKPIVWLSRLPGSAQMIVRLFSVPAVLADPGPLNLFTKRGFGRDVVRDLMAPALHDREIAADLRAFLRSVRAEQLVSAAEALRGRDLRAAVVWSRRDRVFPPRDAERLAELLGTDVTWLDDALTFVPWDRPDAVAQAILAVRLPTAA